MDQERAKRDTWTQDVAQQSHSSLAVFEEARGDGLRGPIPILFHPPGVRAVNRETTSDEHRQNASDRSSLHGLVNQQVRRHILDAPARAQRRRFPILRRERAEEREEIPPLVTSWRPGRRHSVAVRRNSTLVVIGDGRACECSVDHQADVIAVAAVRP